MMTGLTTTAILGCEGARIYVKGVINMLKAMDVARYFLYLDTDGKMFREISICI